MSRSGKILSIGIAVVALGLGAFALSRTPASVRSHVGATGVPSEADEAAARGLREVEYLLSSTGYKDSGFANAAEVRAATLGTPYSVHALLPAAVESYDGTQRIADLLVPLEELRYPVLVGGNVRTLILVSRQGGSWEFAGFGVDQDLGPRLQSVRARLNDPQATVKLVMQNQTLARFALVEHDGRERLVYLGGYEESYPGVDPSGLMTYTPQEIMPKIRAAVRAWRQAQ